MHWLRWMSTLETWFSFVIQARLGNEWTISAPPLIDLHR